MKTTRQALRKLCTGKADAEVTIHRRPLRWLLDLAEAAEEWRHAQNALAALHVEGRFGEEYEDGVRRIRAAQHVLDEHLEKLEVLA